MKLLLVCMLVSLQSYCSDGSSHQKQQTIPPIGNVAFGPEGEITGIATKEQADATGALVDNLWAMSCQQVTCTKCPRCVGKELALAQQTGSQEQIDAVRRKLQEYLSQANPLRRRR